LPPAILKRLIGDLMRLASSPPTSQTFPGTRPPTHAATWATSPSERYRARTSAAGHFGLRTRL